MGMVDPDCATDDSDNDEDDVRRVDEHRATRATVGRGHRYASLPSPSFLLYPP